jgi:hypothetical protein
VHCVELKKTFLKASHAAYDLRVSPQSISKVMNGDLPHAGGYTFVKPTAAQLAAAQRAAEKKHKVTA